MILQYMQYNILYIIIIIYNNIYDNYIIYNIICT